MWSKKIYVQDEKTESISLGGQKLGETQSTGLELIISILLK